MKWLESLEQKYPIFKGLNDTLPIFAIVITFIVIYFGYLLFTYGKNNMAQHDPFNKIIFNIKDDCCSSWAISHFILFFIIGYLFPDAWIVLILGILWEFAEDFLGSVKIIKGKSVRTITGTQIQYNNWWSGSMKDIMLNTLGFLLGRTTKKLIN